MKSPLISTMSPKYSPGSTAMGWKLRRIAVEGHVSRGLAFPTDSGESMAIAQPVPADARMVATSLSIWVSISGSLVMSSHNRARMPSLGLASLRIAIRRF